MRVPSLAHSRLAVPVALVAMAGCAMMEKPNRRALNALDHRIHIESRALRIAAAPLMVPLATGALAADALVVHPVASIPRAADDTAAVLWGDRRQRDFREVLVLPLRAAATPVVFVGDWILRATLSMDEEPRR